MENITWIVEDLKVLISPDEHDRAYDTHPEKIIGFEFSDDLENKTGFSWCPGTQLKPQGIYWVEEEGFILVDGSSRYNRFDQK